MGTSDQKSIAPGMRGQLTVATAGIAAGLLCNFWVLEDVLAKRTDFSAAWISDLAARSQAGGWRFQLLEVLAGLAITGFALLLLRRDGRRSAPVRRGLIALVVVGVLAAIGGAAPLNCAEALERSCDLSYDPFDLIHTSANLLEIAALALAFAWVGAGLVRLDPRDRLGRATLTIGAIWLLLMIATGLSYMVGDLDSAKGLFQRCSQLLLGGWLAVLGVYSTTSTVPCISGWKSQT